MRRITRLARSRLWALRDARRVLPASVATDLLAFYRDWMPDAPDELNVTMNLMTAPPEPFVPEAMQLQPAVGVQICYVGDIETGKKVVAPLTATFPPAVDLVAPMPYTVHQALNDP